MGHLDLILYTHTDYADVWPIYFGQSKKYFPDASKIIFVNKDDERIQSNHRVVLYDDKLNYRERVLSCLNQINSKYIIYHHEDMFLYGEPDYDRIIKYLDRISSLTSQNFVKLIRGGMSVGLPDALYNELKIIDYGFDYIFAIQPSIWYHEKFKEVFEYGKGNTIWEFEIDAQRVCRERNIFGYYVDDGGVQRGKYHWDSTVYPYVATAIVKGKWNSEYVLVLNKLCAQYKINPNIRGWS